MAIYTFFLKKLSKIKKSRSHLFLHAEHIHIASPSLHNLRKLEKSQYCPPQKTSFCTSILPQSKHFARPSRFRGSPKNRVYLIVKKYPPSRGGWIFHPTTPARSHSKLCFYYSRCCFLVKPPAPLFSE